MALENGLNVLQNKQIELIARKKSALSGTNDIYNEYMHIYQNVCELATEAGTDGCLLLREGLNEIKKEQADIIAKNNGQTKGGG